MGWKAKDIPDLSGRVAVVTGGNGGLGYETSLQLAVHGAHVVMGVRNLDKAAQAVERIREKTPNASLEVRALDLASLESIKRFSAEVRAAHPRIDFLFDNAGVMAVKEGTTADGFETQFGTNVLGHFALTLRLLPALLAAPTPRVMCTTSTARFLAGKYDLSNPFMHGCYDPWDAYGMSKRADLQFALELNRRMKERALPLAAFGADPGFSKTDLQPASLRANAGLMQRFWTIAVALTGQSAASGALPQLRAATDPKAVGGTLYAPRFVTIGAPVVRGIGKGMRKPEQLVQLWELAERETGLTLEAALKG
jgi:NAD(P)-dependent dehydrogenase (short-subunit alcohol dehydrogenase family)